MSKFSSFLIILTFLIAVAILFMVLTGRYTSPICLDLI